MTITLKNLRWTRMIRTGSVQKDLTKREEKQLANKIEKFLQKEYSVMCNVSVR